MDQMTDPMATANLNTTANLAQIGAIFDDKIVLMIGGIAPDTKPLILEDLQLVQAGLRAFLGANEGIDDTQTGLRVQLVIDQIDLEFDYINGQSTAGVYTPRGINDIQRDILDIINADPVLAQPPGFTQLPDLLRPPAPFPLNAEQTAFINNFVDQSFALGAAAVEAAATPGDRGDAALIQQIQAFAANAAAFSAAQGGLYAARFDNEFAQNGNTGTLARALVEAIRENNTTLANAAAELLAQNALDVSGNQQPINALVSQPNHADTFTFAGDFGHQMIVHFDPNGPNHDAIVFDKNTGITSFDDLINNHLYTANEGGGPVVLADNGSTLALDMSWMPLDQAQLQSYDCQFV
jgi:hypothetical protein